MRAWVKIPDSTNYHQGAWISGLCAAGYKATTDRFTPVSGDLLVIWNRGVQHTADADEFEKAGGNVLVAENGYLGKWWNGHKWFALSVGHHNGAGWYPYLPDRWDRYAIILPAWRQHGTEVVALPQRGIGEAGVAMPRGWEPSVRCRIRPHLGIKEAIPLEDDLIHAKAVITWGSGAAIKAMALGIPVVYEFREWIGKDAATHISVAEFDNLEQFDRLPTFRKVLSAMWTVDEVASGLPFKEMHSANFGHQ